MPPVSSTMQAFNPAAAGGLDTAGGGVETPVVVGGATTDVGAGAGVEPPPPPPPFDLLPQADKTRANAATPASAAVVRRFSTIIIPSGPGCAAGAMREAPDNLSAPAATARGRALPVVRRHRIVA